VNGQPRTPIPLVGGADPRALALAAIALCLGLVGCGSAKVSGQREVGAAPAARPTVIYVADFELDTQTVKRETRVLPLPPPPPGPLGGILPKPPGSPKEPAERARELVDLMSTSLVENLTKAGLTAHRLAAGAPQPADGWLLRGIFTEVDEGNRIRRAVVGFGAGQTQLQLVVAVEDLARGVPRPFYEVDTAADSGKAPGAGPVIVLNPAVGAARFVLAGSDLDRNVKQAAAKIAADLAARVQK
jgi:hypothetical protein